MLYNVEFDEDCEYEDAELPTDNEEIKRLFAEVKKVKYSLWKMLNYFGRDTLTRI